MCFGKHVLKARNFDATSEITCSSKKALGIHEKRLKARAFWENPVLSLIMTKSYK
jgi:hypothetical protein